MGIFFKNASTVVIRYLYMKMELLIYFLKLKIKQSKETKILKAIQDFWTMFSAQEKCCWSRKCFRRRKSDQTDEPAFCGNASSDRYGSTTGHVCLVMFNISPAYLARSETFVKSESTATITKW